MKPLLLGPNGQAGAIEMKRLVLGDDPIIAQQSIFFITIKPGKGDPVEKTVTAAGGRSGVKIFVKSFFKIILDKYYCLSIV